MRRLLAFAVTAGAFAIATPAQATPVCYGTDRVGVCVRVVGCPRICGLYPVVDPYCVQGHPATGACATIDAIYLEPDVR